MGKAIEPCIFEEAGTSRYAAGFRVRKQVRDQWNQQRQITEIFRPSSPSPAARERALKDARNFVEQIEREKRTGQIYRRFDAPLPSHRQKPRGYSINWAEYTAEERREIEEELAEEAEAELREQNAATMRQHVEKKFLPWIEENNSKSDHDKKKAAWRIWKLYDKAMQRSLASRTIDRIRPSDVDGFVDWLERQRKTDGQPKYSRATIKGYFAVVRSFFRHWAADEGKPNPADPAILRTDTARIKGRAAPTKVVPDANLELLAEGIEKSITKASQEKRYRRYLYARVLLRYLHPCLLNTGMRIGEALFLTPAHVDFDEKTITIEGDVVNRVPGWTKTGKKLGAKEAGTRLIPMSSSVETAITDWLRVRVDHGYPAEAENIAIFCDRSGRYLTDQMVRSYYETACGDVELSPAVSPHQLRHTCNDRLRRNGVPTEIREAVLGHRDSDTNARYTRVQALEARGALEALAATRTHV